MNTQLTEICRLLRNLIRVGTIAELDLKQAKCRVTTGNITTDWLVWLTTRAGAARTWWAPSVGEQVLLLSIGGELTTSFVLPAIFSDDFPEPSQSEQAFSAVFPDGAVFHYEPASSTLTVNGLKQINLIAESIRLETPHVICTQKLSATQLDVQGESSFQGNIRHRGGQLSSNGVVLDAHQHQGVRAGGDNSGRPVE